MAGEEEKPRFMKAVATYTRESNHLFYDLDRWDEVGKEDRSQMLLDAIYDDYLEDLDIDTARGMIDNCKIKDQNGNLFSFGEVMEMTSSELILRGILKAEDD